MKKLSVSLLAVAALAIASCTGNDDDSNNNVSSNLTGTYELTSATSATAQDYDGDGDSNKDLVLEGTCFNDSWISFHENGTYEESFTNSVSGQSGTSLSCNTKVSTGTYTQNGNTITTSRTAGEGSLSATYTFNTSAKTLTRTENNGSYSAFNNATALWANTTGNLNLTFTKYTDNDDVNGDGQNDDSNIDVSGAAKLIGNFDLTSFVVATAQDLDHNGSGSTNLVTESNCYGASNITFNQNGTYSEESSTSILGTGGLTLTCNTETKTGTYTRNGNTVITRQGSGNATVNTSYTLNTTTNTLTRTDNNGQYVGFSSITSLFSNLNGAVNYTYSK